MKRFISILIAVSIIIGMIPVTVQATEGDQIEVDNGNMTVEGTNSFGSLLSEEIMESQNENDAAAEEYEEGYSILDLEIEGNIATVSYSTLESANLVVAIYTEDGIQLVTSGTTKVDPEETIATVILEGEMPTYFMVSAYLLDCYDMSPLCVPYDTPMYTKDMQELLASTVDDYDTDRVFNLDNNDTTNFAVYSEDTIVIDQVEGVNTIVEIDDENATYRIEEADENITSLQEGDIFVYPYCEEDTLIVKVASIDVDNATVTITGAELELEEVFSAVKVEGESYTEEMSVDDSTATEGITYEGVEADENCVL